MAVDVVIDLTALESQGLAIDSFNPARVAEGQDSAIAARGSGFGAVAVIGRNTLVGKAAKCNPTRCLAAKIWTDRRAIDTVSAPPDTRYQIAP